MTNGYSERWFDTFLGAISLGQTAHEADFLREHLPLSDFRRVLDVCCGRGRHSRLLNDAGYDMTGIDSDAGAVAFATQAAPAARFFVADLRDLNDVVGEFDAVICLWQSFGCFDDATNQTVLQQMHRLLRPGGRLILDVYNAAFFREHTGEHTFVREGQRITENKRLDNQRLQVELQYHDAGATDRFDWRIYSNDELCELGATVGFRAILSCAAFDAACPPSPATPRMQLVFKKPDLRGGRAIVTLASSRCRASCGVGRRSN